MEDIPEVITVESASMEADWDSAWAQNSVGPVNLDRNIAMAGN